MQNSVLSTEAGSASLRDIRVMSAKSGLDLLPGFTSAGGRPQLDIDFPV